MLLHHSSVKLHLSLAQRRLKRFCARPASCARFFVLVQAPLFATCLFECLLCLSGATQHYMRIQAWGEYRWARWKPSTADSARWIAWPEPNRSKYILVWCKLSHEIELAKYYYRYSVRLQMCSDDVVEQIDDSLIMKHGICASNILIARL